MLPVIVSLFVSVLVTRIVGGPECWKTLLGMRSKCDPPDTARYKCITMKHNSLLNKGQNWWLFPSCFRFRAFTANKILTYLNLNITTNFIPSSRGNSLKTCIKRLPSGYPSGYRQVAAWWRLAAQIRGQRGRKVAAVAWWRWSHNRGFIYGSFVYHCDTFSWLLIGSRLQSVPSTDDAPLTLISMMTSAQVVEISVITNKCYS